MKATKLFSVIFLSAWSYLIAQDTVAVMNFEVNKLDKEAGSEVADLVSALLSEAGNVQVVERTELKKLLAEQEMGQQGLTESETAAKVQKLYGAKFYISGKLFPVGSKLFLTASLVSSETSLKKTISVKEAMSDDYSSLAEQAAMKLVETYLESAESMKPRIETPAIAVIKEAIGDKAIPRIAIHIPEQHISQPVPDPAVQTEFMFLLQSLGGEVAAYKEKVESGLLLKGEKEVTVSLDQFDVLITGEAFSTFGGREGNLVSCKARVELKATDAKTGKLLCVGRESVAGVDVSEPLAAKKALQMTADKLARSFLPEVIKIWNQGK